MPDKNDVPLMFRAQIEGRCQLQRIYKRKDLDEIAQKEGVKSSQYSERWVNEWLEVDSGTKNPFTYFSDTQNSEQETLSKTIFRTREYTISWRFVTNGGQDDGIIRPVIGAFGLPFYPGSSMKGAFREACEQGEKTGELPKGTCNSYCGEKLEDGSFKPGGLRFHGGYPTNDWTKGLVDIVHPQQQWQVQVMDTTKKPSGESAFTLISLYQPTIKFGISSQLPNTNWQQVWQIWEKAFGYGIGCRVSCGYGIAKEITTTDVLYQTKLHGQGGASKLLDNQVEFRPNIFRAALRGHALRIFSGLNHSLASDIVDELFGGIRSGKEKVGLLGIAFYQDKLGWDIVNGSDVYDVTGSLAWLLLSKLENPEHRPYLEKLVKKLTQFAMLLGGFGKSWRRADHQIFFPKYTNHQIGCHWSWVNENDNIVETLEDAASLIKETLNAALTWMRHRKFEIKTPAINPPQTSTSTSRPNNPNLPQLNKPTPRPVQKQNQAVQETEWRETWSVDNVQVWGRIANKAENSKIIPLLHSPQKAANQQSQKAGYSNQPRKAPNQSTSLAFQRATPQANQPSKPVIYRTCVTGCLKDTNKSNDPTRIGRLWHRMYPLKNGQYLELITIFPKGCAEAETFLKWLATQSEWKKLWGSNS